MTTYKSKRAEMLERLFVEERENAEYSHALKETEKEASNFEVIMMLPKLEKLKAIESAVYKKLFGDDPSNMKTSLTDEAEEEIVQFETLPLPASKRKRKMVDTASNDGTGFAQPNLGSANQASKPAAPAEVKLLSRLEENSTATKLIPRKPGGKIHQYTSFAPATYDCRTYWSAEHGSQIQAAQTALNVHFQTEYKDDVEFRLWPEPADWKAFETDLQKGREILARAEKFLDFWIWEFLSRITAEDRVPLTPCLDWFLGEDESPEYKRYVKLSVAPKPTNALAAKASFQLRLA